MTTKTPNPQEQIQNTEAVWRVYYIFYFIFLFQWRGILILKMSRSLDHLTLIMRIILLVRRHIHLYQIGIWLQRFAWCYYRTSMWTPHCLRYPKICKCLSVCVVCEINEYKLDIFTVTDLYWKINDNQYDK